MNREINDFRVGAVLSWMERVFHVVGSASERWNSRQRHDSQTHEWERALFIKSEYEMLTNAWTGHIDIIQLQCKVTDTVNKKNKSM